MPEKYIYMQNLMLEEWRKSEIHIGQIFNYDGIVNPEIWFSDKQQGKRILFILKEAYHDDDYATKHGLTYSLCDALKENAIPSAMWKRVAEWSFGILNTSGNSLAEYTELDGSEQKKMLNQIAVMNLKKSNGKPTSDKDDISEYVNADKVRLRTQFDLINPDIVVCGNTFEWFNEIIDGEIDKKRDALHTWVYKWNDKIVFDYYHPANQFPTILNYYGIVAPYLLVSKTNCGNESANIKIVDDKEVSIDIISRQMALAQSYIEANDFSNADNCADAILSVDTKNSFGWLVKAKVASHSNSKEKLTSAMNFYQNALENAQNMSSETIADIEAEVKAVVLALINIFAYEMLGKSPTDFDAYKRKPAFDKNVASIEKLAAIFEDENNSIPLNGIIFSMPAMLFAASSQIRDGLIKRADASGRMIKMNSNYVRLKNGIDSVMQIAEHATDMENDKKKKSIYFEKLIEWADHRIYLATHYPSDVNGRIQYKVWLLSGNEKAEVISKKDSYEAELNAIKQLDAKNNKWFCDACGEEMLGNEKFCIKCGTKRTNC